MITDVTVLVLGLLATVAIIMSSLSIRRIPLILFSLANSFLVIWQLLVIGGSLSVVLLVIGGLASKVVVLLGETKFLWLRSRWVLITILISYVTVFVLSLFFVETKWYAILPMVGAGLNFAGTFIRDMAITKKMTIAGCLLWVIFFMITGLWTQVIGESFALIAKGVALWRLSHISSYNGETEDPSTSHPKTHRGQKPQLSHRE